MSFRLIAQKLKRKNLREICWSKFVTYWSESFTDCRKLCELGTIYKNFRLIAHPVQLPTLYCYSFLLHYKYSTYRTRYLRTLKLCLASPVYLPRHYVNYIRCHFIIPTVVYLCFYHRITRYRIVLLQFKGTVSRELRPMLLYIIGKLFSRPIVASLKIFILLKGQFAMYIKPFSVS